MKQLIKFLAVGVASLFMACNKQRTGCELVPAKIIRYDCDRVVFQFLSPERIGDSSWKDEQSGNIYTNVASYFNTCEIARITNGEFKILYVKPELIDTSLTAPDCNQCQALSIAPPASMVDFTEIAESPCDVYR